MQRNDQTRLCALVAASFLACGAAQSMAQTLELVEIPEGTPVGASGGTHGTVVYENTAPAFFTLLGGGVEIADDLHLTSAGNMVSFDFTVSTGSGTTAVVNFYTNNPTDTILPSPSGLIASFAISNMPPFTTFTQTVDLVTPVALPQDIWVGVITGSFFGGVTVSGFQVAPTVGTSHNVLFLVGFGAFPGIQFQANLVVRFGEASPPPPPVDSDGDGVPDEIDICPGADDLSDVDADGVPDECDVCPADPLELCNQSGSTAAAIMASEGGTVQTPDGGLTMAFDPGTLSANTTISVTQTISPDPQVDLTIGPNPGLGRALATYVLEPDGTEFVNPMTLTIVVDVTSLNANQRDRLTLYLLTDTNGDGVENSFVEVPGTTSVIVEDPPGSGIFLATLTAQVSHISVYAAIAPLDSDGDGIPDLFPPLDEATLGTNPLLADTDGDGLDDGVEVALAEFGCPSPTVADSDFDGLLDGEEILLGLDPCNCDFDADGLADGVEIAFGTDPFVQDTDGDGLLDGTEVDVALGSGCPNPLVVDSDLDGLSDGQEVNVIGSNPCSADTDGDGVGDAVDPLPIDAGVTDDFAADLANDIAAAVDLLFLVDIVGPNNNARKGRRNSLANRLRNASKALLQADFSSTLDLLNGVLAKMDGLTPPSDWVEVSAASLDIVADIELLISLVELNL